MFHRSLGCCVRYCSCASIIPNLLFFNSPFSQISQKEYRAPSSCALSKREYEMKIKVAKLYSSRLELSYLPKLPSGNHQVRKQHTMATPFKHLEWRSFVVIPHLLLYKPHHPHYVRCSIHLQLHSSFTTYHASTSYSQSLPISSINTKTLPQHYCNSITTLHHGTDSFSPMQQACLLLNRST